VTARVEDLMPGERITLPGPFEGMSSTFVARTQHPLWPSLQLVIWKMDDGTWSLDALDARQEIGDTAPSTEVERMNNLRTALLGRP
jgi:hypothetical protein